MIDGMSRSCIGLQIYQKHHCPPQQHSKRTTSTNIFHYFSRPGMAYDTATTRAWNNHNKGKLWQDIREKVTAEQND